MMAICICCEVIDKEVTHVARLLARQKKENVYIISLTETLEVNYEEVSEMQSEEEAEA